MPQRVRAADQSAGRLDLDALAARLEEQLSDYEPVGWRPSRSRGRNDEVLVAPHAEGDLKVLWIDPARGTIHGTPASSSQTLTGWLLELHYTLLGGHAGTLVAGVFAALLCLLGISGVRIYRNFWKSFLLLRWNSSGRIFFSDLHKMAGISSAGFNFDSRLHGSLLESHTYHWSFSERARPATSKNRGQGEGRTLSPEGLLEQARTQIPGFEWTDVSLPTRIDEPITFYGRLKNQHALRGQFGSSVTFNSQTGSLEGLVDIRTTGFWNQFTDSFAPLHYGSFAALPVKILWSLGRASSGYPGDHGISSGGRESGLSKHRQPEVLQADLLLERERVLMPPFFPSRAFLRVKANDAPGWGASKERRVVSRKRLSQDEVAGGVDSRTRACEPKDRLHLCFVTNKVTFMAVNTQFSIAVHLAAGLAYDCRADQLRVIWPRA